MGLGDEEEEEESGEMEVDEEMPKNIDKLVDTYSYTMSSRDLKLLAEIYRRDSTLNCLIFKLLETQTTETSETLNKQAKITDFISLKLNDTLLAESILNFPLTRKLENIADPASLKSSSVYDPIYLLPNIYNLLDYGKINVFIG